MSRQFLYLQISHICHICRKSVVISADTDDLGTGASADSIPVGYADSVSRR